MNKERPDAGNLQPIEQEEADDAHYRALSRQVSSWTGTSVSDIPKAALNHFPELLESGRLEATVPQEVQGLVRGKRITLDVHNSCAYKELCLRVFAIDAAGQALIRKTTHHAYEDVDDNRFETVAQSEALALVAQYRRDAAIEAETQPAQKLDGSDFSGTTQCAHDADRCAANAVAASVLEDLPNVRSVEFCVGETCNVIAAGFIESPTEMYGADGGHFYIDSMGDTLNAALDQHIDTWQAAVRSTPEASHLAITRDPQGVTVSPVVQPLANGSDL